MSEQRTPVFTFTQRLGNTNFKVNVYCKDDTDVTYEDRLLALIRSGILAELEKQDIPKDEHPENHQVA